MKVWIVGFGWDCNGGHRVFTTKELALKACDGWDAIDGPEEVELEGATLTLNWANVTDAQCADLKRQFDEWNASKQPQATEKCPECDGKGEYLDAESDGDAHTFMATCSACGGTGKKPKGDAP